MKLKLIEKEIKTFFKKDPAPSKQAKIKDEILAMSMNRREFELKIIQEAFKKVDWWNLTKREKELLQEFTEFCTTMETLAITNTFKYLKELKEKKK